MRGEAVRGGARRCRPTMNACLVCLGALVAGLLAQAGLAGARDYYVGMFKRNDYLVAQDTLYAQRVPFNIAYAKYGRVFSCPVSAFCISLCITHDQLTINLCTV